MLLVSAIVIAALVASIWGRILELPVGISAARPGIGFWLFIEIRSACMQDMRATADKRCKIMLHTHRGLFEILLFCITQVERA